MLLRVGQFVSFAQGGASKLRVCYVGATLSILQLETRESIKNQTLFLVICVCTCLGTLCNMVGWAGSFPQSLHKIVGKCHLKLLMMRQPVPHKVY